MNITIEDIDNYLDDVKTAVRKNRFRIALNSKRIKNKKLFLDYVLTDKTVKKIIFGLTSMDFSEILVNKHAGYEHELLYVFGKDVELRPKQDLPSKKVSLYIKFNKLENCYVIIVSLHEQQYPMKYYFR